MSLQINAAVKQHLFGSTINYALSIINDTTGAPVTAQSPTVAIRRNSDGFFYNGTVFVDTIGIPTNLSMTEVGAIAAAGLYIFNMIDPGPIVPTAPTIQLAKDTYQLRFVNSGSPPTGGTIWDLREYSRQLRDINTQGS